MQKRLCFLIATMILVFGEISGSEAEKIDTPPQWNEAVSLYKQGRTLLESPEQSAKRNGIALLQKAASVNPPFSQSIALLLLRKKLYDEAERLLEKAAQAGDIMSAYELGKLYLKADSPKHDDVKALKTFEKIAMQYNMAAYSAGEMYLNGRGVTANREKAYTYFILATVCREHELPCEPAFIRVAEYYQKMKDETTPFNACIYYLLAKRNGFSEGTLIDYDKILSGLGKKLSPEEKLLFERILNP